MKTEKTYTVELTESEISRITLALIENSTASAFLSCMAAGGQARKDLNGRAIASTQIVKKLSRAVEVAQIQNCNCRDSGQMCSVCFYQHPG